MFKMMSDIADFHKKFGQEYLGRIRALPWTYAQFRHKFMIEEADEWLQAQAAIHQNLNEHEQGSLLDSHDTADLTHNFHLALDSVIDQLYITLGNAYAQGFTAAHIHQAWYRVHEANMKKIKSDAENPSTRGYAAYDIVKPKGWTPPDHSDLVEDHAHQIP